MRKKSAGLVLAALTACLLAAATPCTALAALPGFQVYAPAPAQEYVGQDVIIKTKLLLNNTPIPPKLEIEFQWGGRQWPGQWQPKTVLNFNKINYARFLEGVVVPNSVFPESGLWRFRLRWLAPGAPWSDWHNIVVYTGDSLLLQLTSPAPYASCRREVVIRGDGLPPAPPPAKVLLNFQHAGDVPPGAFPRWTPAPVFGQSPNSIEYWRLKQGYTVPVSALKSGWWRVQAKRDAPGSAWSHWVEFQVAP